MKKIFFVAGWMVLIFAGGCSGPVPERGPGSADTYIVAAYVWPSCHDEPRSRDVFWSGGIGEWEIIQQGDPRYARFGKDQVVHRGNTP